MNDKEISKPIKNKEKYDGDYGECGACGALLNQDSYIDFRYCPCCGNKIDWGVRREGAR
jgi:predicted RNA-binding Zn-ribbon protein involved in translation (DUF1610 family)